MEEHLGYSGGLGSLLGWVHDTPFADISTTSKVGVERLLRHRCMLGILREVHMCDITKRWYSKGFLWNY